MDKSCDNICYVFGIDDYCCLIAYKPIYSQHLHNSMSITIHHYKNPDDYTMLHLHKARKATVKFNF